MPGVRFSNPNPPTTSTNAPPATQEKEFTTLPPIEEEEDPNPIIPPSVDFPMPIELPPHRIDKPVTMIAGASRGLGLEFVSLTRSVCIIILKFYFLMSLNGLDKFGTALSLTGTDSFK